MKSLTVFFNSDKVYSGVFERSARGLTLIDVSSTLDPVYLEDLDSDISRRAINQINRNLNSLDEKIEELNVVLTNENAFWAIVPGKVSMDSSSLRQLLELEVRNNFKSFSVDEFIFRVYPFGSKDENEPEMIFVVFIKKQVVENCRKVLEVTGLDMNYITIAQIASQNTIEYNYPDTSHLYDLLINVEESFCDISLSNDNTTYFYDLLNVTDQSAIIDNIQSTILKLKAKGLAPGNILAIGTNLKRNFLEELKNNASIEVDRLNSFRLVRADIDQRLKDYCIRTAHIYAPVVGGALNSFDKGTIIEL